MAIGPLIVKLFLLFKYSEASDVLAVTLERVTRNRPGFKRTLTESEEAIVTHYVRISSNPFFQHSGISPYRDSYMASLPSVSAEIISDFLGLRSVGFNKWMNVIGKMFDTYTLDDPARPRWVVDEYISKLAHSFSVHPIFIALGIFDHPDRREKIRSAGEILFHSRDCRNLTRKRLHFHLGFMMLATMDRSAWSLFEAPEVFDLLTPFRGMARLYRDLANTNGLLEQKYYSREGGITKYDLNSVFILAFTNHDDLDTTHYIESIFHMGVRHLPNSSNYSEDGSLEGFSRWFQKEFDQIHSFLREPHDLLMPGLSSFVVPYSPLDRELILQQNEILLHAFIEDCINGRPIDVSFQLWDGCRYSALMRSVMHAGNTEGEVRKWFDLTSLKALEVTGAPGVVNYFGLQDWIERQVMGISQVNLGDVVRGSVNSGEITDWVWNHPLALARGIAMADDPKAQMGKPFLDPKGLQKKLLRGLLVLAGMPESFWNNHFGITSEKANEIYRLFRSLASLGELWKFLSDSTDPFVLRMAFWEVDECVEFGKGWSHPTYEYQLEMKESGIDIDESIVFRPSTDEFMHALGITNEYEWDWWCQYQRDAINRALFNIHDTGLPIGGEIVRRKIPRHQ